MYGCYECRYAEINSRGMKYCDNVESNRYGSLIKQNEKCDKGRWEWDVVYNSQKELEAKNV